MYFPDRGCVHTVCTCRVCTHPTHVVCLRHWMRQPPQTASHEWTFTPDNRHLPKVFDLLWRKITSLSEKQKPPAISSHVGLFRNHRTRGGAHLHKSALHVYKNPYEIGRKRDIARSSVQHIAKHDLADENLQALIRVTVIQQMAALYFPKLFLINYDVMLKTE